MNFKPIKSEKVYRQVIQQIKEMIYEGEYKKGDQLPGERHLAQALQVSRAPVREAFRALEILGIVETRQGEGTFITGDISKALIEPLSMFFIIEKNDYQDLIEVRRLLEIEFVIRAAAEANEESIGTLDYYLEIAANSLNNQEDSYNADISFHNSLAKITKNSLLKGLYRTVFGVIAYYIRDAHREIFKEREKAKTLLKQHQNILLAIKQGDKKAGAHYMKEHIQYSARECGFVPKIEESMRPWPFFKDDHIFMNRE